MEDEVEDTPDNTPEIHPAVQLLLARMDSHPEEFVQQARWQSDYEPFKQHWNAEEKRLFRNRLREIQLDEMHKRLLKRVVNGGEQSSGAAFSSEDAWKMQEMQRIQQARQAPYQQISSSPYANSSHTIYPGSFLNTLSNPPF
jgi:hypothetical protein